MQRWCSKLRSLALTVLHESQNTQYQKNSIYSCFSSKRLLQTCPNLLHQKSVSHSLISLNFKPPFPNAPSLPRLTSYPFSPSLMQVRCITAKQRKRKLKSRKPMTPITSKVKKIKMKCYSSFKGRFRIMHDGQIRRWKEGRRHNAHLKSKKAKRRLRQPGVVPVAYAKVMKKLNFSG